MSPLATPELATLIKAMLTTDHYDYARKAEIFGALETLGFDPANLNPEELKS